MCDTFVALSPVTSDGSIIFGKNSDREPNEAQALEYYSPCFYSDSKSRMVNCTYIPVLQVKETHGILISRPFWMWGAEMGANDKGVVIGNEAVFTKMPYEKVGGLTGMDMLRLALERSASSEQALETILQLLADYGQGGVCGYQDKKLFYHNSFIICDKHSAWVLETAGKMWAALEIKEAYSISNGLTIGEKFDKSHPDLIETARRKGWLKKGRVFHFAKNYSDWLFTTFSACQKRQSCSLESVNSLKGKLGVQNALNILRDHNSETYRPDSHLLMNRVCMHAGNGLTRNSGTTGSLVAHLPKGAKNTFWATGTAAPCTSIFKPIRFENDVLPDIGPLPGERFNPASLWWYHESLHRLILDDYPSRMSAYRPARDDLEMSFIKKAFADEKEGIIKLTANAFQQSRELTEKWVKKFRSSPKNKKTNTVFRRYWKKLNRAAGISP